MKIVYIAYSTIPSRSANSIHVMKMCQAIALNGHEVILLVPNKKWESEKAIVDPYDFYGIRNKFEIKKVFCLPIKWKSLIFSFIAGLIAKKIKPDIIYTRSIIAGYLLSFNNNTVIFEYHESINNIFELFCFKRLIRSGVLKHFVVISNALKYYYAEKFPEIKSLILVLPDGADPVSESLVPVTIRNPERRLLVGYTGHLYEGRGMEIISKLAELCSWAEFHIIGGMPADISHWRKLLSKFNNIRMYGYIPHKDISQYLLSFDVLIAPYQERVAVCSGRRHRGGSRDTVKWMSPLKLFEYMAAGKAIIASNVPVLREILKNESNALLVSSDNAEDWKTALIRIRDDLELREQLGRQARIDMEERYSWEKRAKTIFV